MAKNTVERTEGCHVVSFKADPTVDIPKGAAVSISGDYEVTLYADQAKFSQGVALEVHQSGNTDCIPVLLPGPVLRVIIATSGLAAGALVQGEASTGDWIEDTSNPAGFTLEASTGAGDEVDICFVGDQY